MPANAEGSAEAEATEAKPTEATEAKNLGTTMSEINKLISDMTHEIDINEVSTDKASKDTNLDLRHLGGQELCDKDISELKEFSLAGGYKTWFYIIW
jgi:L-serine deaminase